MNLRPILRVLAGCFLAVAPCLAQDRDSPRVGNSERGRILLSILGPKPHDAAGISPLQQQELNRRVRCAATRQEIQDQLDFEAAGSTGFYPLAQLREMEKEACTPVPQFGLPASPQPAAQGTTNFHPPAPRAGVAAASNRNVQTGPIPSVPLPAPPPPRPAPVVSAPSPSVAQASAASIAAPATTPTSSAVPPRTPTAAPPNGPSYTPAPDYPQDEMAAGHEGTVLVQLVMNPDGSVKAATVAKSSTFPTLDAAALQAARVWRIPAAAGRTINVPLKFSSH